MGIYMGDDYKSSIDMIIESLKEHNPDGHGEFLAKYTEDMYFMLVKLKALYGFTSGNIESLQATSDRILEVINNPRMPV